MTLPDPRTLLLFTDPAYQAPSPADVKAVLDLLPCTQEQIAGLTGVKSGRVVQRWKKPVTDPDHAEMEFAKWRLLLLEAGLVPPPAPRRKVAKPLRPPKVNRSR